VGGRVPEANGGFNREVVLGGLIALLLLIVYSVIGWWSFFS
jgi:hypothetical protein